MAIGPRQGETLGLCWPAIDLNAGTVEIGWQLQRLPWQHGCEDPHACGAKHHRRPCPARNCPRRRPTGRPHVCRTKLCPADCGGVHPGVCVKVWCPPDCEGHAKAGPAKRDGGLVLTEPKSRKSLRTAPIPRPLAEWLVLHQLAQTAEREADGWAGWGHDPRACSRRPRAREVVCPKCRRPVKRDALVFTQPNGMPVSPSDDWRDWSAFLVELGLPHYRPHDLRHLSVTTQLEEGVDVRVVADNHGHANPDFTRKRYQHVAERVQRDSADRVSGVWWGAPRDSSN